MPPVVRKQERRTQSASADDIELVTATVLMGIVILLVAFLSPEAIRLLP